MNAYVRSGRPAGDESLPPHLQLGAGEWRARSIGEPGVQVHEQKKRQGQQFESSDAGDRTPDDQAVLRLRDSLQRHAVPVRTLRKMPTSSRAEHLPLRRQGGPAELRLTAPGQQRGPGRSSTAIVCAPQRSAQRYRHGVSVPAHPGRLEKGDSTVRAVQIINWEVRTDAHPFHIRSLRRCCGEGDRPRPGRVRGNFGPCGGCRVVDRDGGGVVVDSGCFHRSLTLLEGVALGRDLHPSQEGKRHQTPDGSRFSKHSARSDGIQAVRQMTRRRSELEFRQSVCGVS